MAALVHLMRQRRLKAIPDAHERYDQALSELMLERRLAFLKKSQSVKRGVFAILTSHRPDVVEVRL